MDHRLQGVVALIAGLRATAGLAHERRMAAIERLLQPLGEIMDASVGLLIREGQRAPVLLGAGNTSKLREGRAAKAPRGCRKPGTTGGGHATGQEEGERGACWVRWLEPLHALPPDGVARRGVLLPGDGGVVAEPAGWGRSGCRRVPWRGGRPLLAIGVVLDREPMRLILLREPGGARFSREEADLLAGIVEHLLLHSKIANRLEKLRRETVTDELTRLFNYRYLKRTLRGALRRLRLGGGVLSVVMVDVDNLREYNNRFGHLKASAVLAQVGEALNRSMTAGGWIAKYGGDEFLIVLPGAQKAKALALADRLRLAIERSKCGDASFGGITCSFGVGTAPGDGITPIDLLGAADRALFRAKAQGRNTVVGALHRSEPDTERRAA